MRQETETSILLVERKWQKPANKSMMHAVVVLGRYELIEKKEQRGRERAFLGQNN